MGNSMKINNSVKINDLKNDSPLTNSKNISLKKLTQSKLDTIQCDYHSQTDFMGLSLNKPLEGQYKKSLTKKELKVLIVDDNPFNIQSLAGILQISFQNIFDV